MVIFDFHVCLSLQARRGSQKASDEAFLLKSNPALTPKSLVEAISGDNRLPPEEEHPEKHDYRDYLQPSSPHFKYQNYFGWEAEALRGYAYREADVSLS